MTRPDYTTSFTVDQSPEEVFAAITNVRGWWSGEIEGDTGRLGAEFTYRVPDVHYCRMRITEFIPGTAVVWHVLDSDISYTKERNEWDATRIAFEISRQDGKTEVRFTHRGLVPQFECYNACSDAWSALVKGNLRNLITTGRQQPNLFGSEV
jgi:uncharacterized protein YndB with AHSA1/START domain